MKILYTMFAKITLLITIITLISSGCFDDSTENDMIKPPKAEKIKKVLTIHGHTRIDNYYWLNERDNPEVTDYLKAENNYTDFVMRHTKDFQEKLYKEMIGRIKKDDESVPYLDNNYYYYTRYEKDSEHPIYCRKKKNLEAAEEIMLNVNIMAEDFSYYKIGDWEVSPNNQYIAYGVDTLSRRKYIIRIKDLSSGEILPDKIPNTTASVAWANDSKTFFYTLKDNTLRGYKIFRHKLGTDPINDVEVFHEDDATFRTNIYKSKSNRFLIISSSSTKSNEFRILEADNPNGEFKLFHPREADLEYSIYHLDEKFYVIANYNAKNFRMMATPVSKTGKEYWKEVIPHRDDVLLEDLEIFKNYLILEERKDGLTNLRVLNSKDNKEYYLDFGEETYSAWVSDNYEIDNDILRYRYTSLTTPMTTFDFNMKTKEKTLLKQDEVLGDFNSYNY